MSIEFTFSVRPTPKKVEPGQPVRVIVAGNFSGHAATGDQQSGQFSPSMIEADPWDVDAAVARLKPCLSLALGEDAVELAFDSLESFHPDNLHRQIDLFELLGDVRRGLADPTRADNAMVIAAQITGAPDTPKTTEPSATDRPHSETRDELFSRLLGSEPGGSTRASTLVDQFIAEVAREGSVSAMPRDAAAMQDELGKLQQTLMRAILRNPRFRALESNWRALEWLTQHLSADEELELWILDVGALDTAAWTADAADTIRRKLAGNSPSIITALDNLSNSNDALVQLSALADLAETAGCPVMAGNGGYLCGLEAATGDTSFVDQGDIAGDQSEAILQFRSETSSPLCVGFPRILLRQPYGGRSDPVEAFDFEELVPAPDHESFCWGNPSVVLTAAWLAASGDSSGLLEVDDLPMVIYDDGTGQAIMPPTEFYLSDAAADALLANGVVPLVSRRNATCLEPIALRTVGR